MPGFLNLRCFVVAVGLLSAGWGGTLCVAQESSGGEGKNARLGFKFDPKVREEAVAAAESAVAVSEEGPNTDFDPDNLLHLDKLVVTKKAVPLEEREILTPKGRLDLAKKRYLTPAYQKTFGPVSMLATYYVNFLTLLGGWRPNNAEAMALYEDANFKRRRSEMNELLALAEFSDPDVAKIPDAKPLERNKAGWRPVTPGGATP